MYALVIEDNRDFAQLLRDILEIKGCKTGVAYTGHAGLDIARQTMPDIIFCDIGLPGMDGLEFARQLRADAPISHIPLVAVSGYSTEEDKEWAIAAGFNLVFPKPVKFADLSKALAIFSGRDS